MRLFDSPFFYGGKLRKKFLTKTKETWAPIELLTHEMNTINIVTIS